MKLLVTLAAAALTSLAGAAQATDVGVSVSVSQPGVYGRIDIGRFPQPQVVVERPVVIERPVVVARPIVVEQPVQPVYLYVPHKHRQNWRHHCRHYDACGVPVYFVRHDWYERKVVEHHHYHHRGKHAHKGRHKHDRDDD